jgi:hypothetical protein
LGAGIHASQLLGHGEGTLGLTAVGQEAAGLPAHQPLRQGRLPAGEGGLERVAVNAQLLGSLPQPDLTCELRAWPYGTWPTLGADSVLSAADVGVLAAMA